MRQLLQVRVLAQHGLRDHLRQLHGGHGGRQPPVGAEHVHARLYQPHGPAKHDLRVALQLGAQPQPAQVRLQQQVRLDVGIVELGLAAAGAGQLVREALRQAAQYVVLAVADRDVLVLGGGGDDF